MDFVMNFGFKLFYLISILNIVLMIQLPDKQEDSYIFSYITLGHSGLLISWKPKIPQKSNGAVKSLISSQRIKDDQRDKNFHLSKSIFYWFSNQTKIHSLIENTHYEVIFQEYIPKTKAPLKILYSFDMKTNVKTNTKPAKPDFELNFNRSDTGGVLIKWYPCGKEKNCIGKEAGTHFAIKFNPLDRRGEYRIEEYFRDYCYLRLIPGILYEVTVISINNDSETESDRQEIFLMPVFGPVRSIKVELLSNASVSVSWKPPKYSVLDTHTRTRIFEYNVVFINNSIRNDYSLADPEYFTLKKKVDLINTTGIIFEKSKHQLEPGKTYSIFILACTKNCGKAGLEVGVRFTIPVNIGDLFGNGQKCVCLNTEP